MTDPPIELTPGGPASQWVSDTSVEGFEQDVLARSGEVPVVVDFWAPWCEPCGELTPILEKLAAEGKGRWELVKVDIEQCQDLAVACGVESIPLVVAFRDGQPVDSFPGLIPEEAVLEWLERFVPSEASELIKAGMAIEEDDVAGAQEKYRQAAELMPEEASIQILLARVALAQDFREQAEAILSRLAERGFLEPEAQQLQDQLELTSAATEAGGVAVARQAAEAAPEDTAAQLKLAEALAVERKFEEAFAIGLRLAEIDRDGAGQDAREALVKFFALPGADPELVSSTRRRLATLLY